MHTDESTSPQEGTEPAKKAPKPPTGQAAAHLEPRPGGRARTELELQRKPKGRGRAATELERPPMERVAVELELQRRPRGRGQAAEGREQEERREVRGFWRRCSRWPRKEARCRGRLSCKRWGRERRKGRARGLLRWWRLPAARRMRRTENNNSLDC